MIIKPRKYTRRVIADIDERFKNQHNFNKMIAEIDTFLGKFSPWTSEKFEALEKISSKQARVQIITMRVIQDLAFDTVRVKGKQRTFFGRLFTRRKFKLIDWNWYEGQILAIQSVVFFLYQVSVWSPKKIPATEEGSDPVEGVTLGELIEEAARDVDAGRPNPVNRPPEDVRSN